MRLPFTKKRVTLRESLLLNVVAIGVLSIIALITDTRVFLDLAFESQRAAAKELIHSDTNNAMKTLRRISRELGYSLLKENTFKTAIETFDPQLIKQSLDDQFAQYYTTANVIKLEKIYLLNPDYTIAGMSSKGYPVKTDDPLICRNLVASAAHREGANSLKTRSGLCSYSNLSFYGILMPVGLKPHGYLLIVSDPTFSVRELTGMLSEPIQITQANGQAVYTTRDWPFDRDIENYLVVSHHHYFNSPLIEDEGIDHSSVAFTVSIARSTKKFSEKVERTMYITTIATIVALMFAILFAVFIQNRSLRPLVKLQRAAERMGENQYDLITETSFPEIDNVTNAYNAMTKKVEQLIVDLDLARKDAESANQLKSQFLANMSHEIRTPLTSIIGFAESMRDDELTNEQRNSHLKNVLRSGEHLRQVINDILDMSKIEAGKLEIEQIDVDVVSILCDIQSIIEKAAGDKRLKFQLNLETPIPTSICSDAVRIKQILLNLLSNAVKFTEVGSIKLQISCDPKLENLKFSVTDTGIGISDEEMKRLFQPFQQANASMTRRYGGTGLGLSLSRQLAVMLGGDLKATSKPGVGSIFSLEIRTGNLINRTFIEAIDNTQRANESNNDQWKSVELIGNVLLVEDTPELQDLGKIYLTKAGLHVDIANNGSEAISAAQKNKYDLILMDMQMPVMDGLEAVEFLRKNHYEGPIVALTANAMRGDKDRYLSAGCNDYIAKPIDRRRLLTSVANYVKKQRSNIAVTSFADDDPEMLEMVLRFIASLPATKSSLVEAVDRGDWQQASRIAHNLKGLGGSYGYQKLTDLAKSAESVLRDQKLSEVDDVLKPLVDYIEQIIAGENQIRKRA